MCQEQQVSSGFLRQSIYAGTTSASSVMSISIRPSSPQKRSTGHAPIVQTYDTYRCLFDLRDNDESRVTRSERATCGGGQFGSRWETRESE
jgi:hypothetical protein